MPGIAHPWTVRASALRAQLRGLRDRVTPISRRATPVLGLVTPLGWSVLAGAVLCWILGWRCGWVEMMLLATAALVLFVACGLRTIGRTRIDVHVEVDPQRVGAPAAGQVTVTNRARGLLLPILLELPIGIGAARFTLPLLRPDADHHEVFVVPTERRGVIPVGPATTVRGDPLGLLRRTVEWTEVTELFVHPRSIALEPLGAGLLRDLEGQTTNDVSMSDLAFHTLREYQPGDDRRYIHWRSSAKAGRFLVRQFLDTRRSHICVIVDSELAAYADVEDYELAISIAASIAVRVVTDEQELSVVAGEHAAPQAQGRRVLDIFSRAELGNHGMVDLAMRGARIAPGTSIAVLVSGSERPFSEFQRASAHFPPEARVVAVRVDPNSRTGIENVQGLLVLTLRTLSELPALLHGALV